MRMAACAALGALAMAGACAEPQEAELTSVQLVERGDYLVNGVVLCGDCHTPRLENMALDEARELHGAEIAVCGRLSVGKGFLRSSALLVGAAVCSTCWCGTGGPLAIMPSAKTGPDRKHALEALRR